MFNILKLLEKVLPFSHFIKINLDHSSIVFVLFYSKMFLNQQNAFILSALAVLEKWHEFIPQLNRKFKNEAKIFSGTKFTMYQIPQGDSVRCCWCNLRWLTQNAFI